MKNLPSFILAAAGVAAQAQTMGAAEMNIAAVFTEDAVGTIAGVCSTRDPAAKAQWARETQAWKSRNQDSLAELRRLAEGLQAASAEFALAARSQAVITPLHGLASANDSEARRLCARQLANLADPQWDNQNFAAAKAAAAAAIARGGRPR